MKGTVFVQFYTLFVSYQNKPMFKDLFVLLY